MPRVNEPSPGCPGSGLRHMSRVTTTGTSMPEGTVVPSGGSSTDSAAYSLATALISLAPDSGLGEHPVRSRPVIGMRPGLDKSGQFDPRTLFGTHTLPLGQGHGLVRSDDLRHLATDRLEKAHHALLERLALSCHLIDQPGRAGVGGAQHLGTQRAQEPARSAEQTHQVGTATESGGDIQPALDESQLRV